MTGANMWQLRSFSMIQGAANKSELGIFAARGSVNTATFNNLIDNVYIGLAHNAAGNGGNGTIGIYFCAVESSIISNTIIYADTPGVLTANNVYSLTSPNIAMAALPYDTGNTLINNQWSGYNQALLIEGACDNTKIINQVCLKFGLPRRVTPSTSWPRRSRRPRSCSAARSRHRSRTGTATSRRQRSLKTGPSKAPSSPRRLGRPCFFRGRMPGSRIRRSMSSATRRLCSETAESANAGATGNDIALYTGQSIAAPATPPTSNRVFTAILNPTVTWSAVDTSAITQSSSNVSIGRLNVAGTSGLPAATAGTLYVRPQVASPSLGRIYVGDGTGWQLDFARRTGSADTVLYSLLDTGAMQTTGVAPPAVSAANAAGSTSTRHSTSTASR